MLYKLSTYVVAPQAYEERIELCQHLGADFHLINESSTTSFFDLLSSGSHDLIVVLDTLVPLNDVRALTFLGMALCLDRKVYVIVNSKDARNEYGRLLDHPNIQVWNTFSELIQFLGGQPVKMHAPSAQEPLDSRFDLRRDLSGVNIGSPTDTPVGKVPPQVWPSMPTVKQSLTELVVSSEFPPAGQNKNVPVKTSPLETAWNAVRSLKD